MIDRIPASAYRRMVWKNGLGVTEEIAVSPPGATVASQFSARLSRARVTAGGPFSSFPGCDRILTVIDGEGLSLTVSGQTIALARFQPFRFAGDHPVTAVLARGPVTDFNVIFDRERVDASCDVLELDENARDLPAGSEQFLYCAGGALECGGVSLDAGDTAQADASPMRVVARAAPAIAVHVRLWSR